MYLAVKTAGELTEIFLYEGMKQKKEKRWAAGRELSKELLGEISQIVAGEYGKLSGLVVFVGPGSFTGLRIGISVVNALSYSKNLPIVGESGNQWIENGLKRLLGEENDKIVTPQYGGEANITQPKNN